MNWPSKASVSELFREVSIWRFGENCSSEWWSMWVQFVIDEVRIYWFATFEIITNSEQSRRRVVVRFIQELILLIFSLIHLWVIDQLSCVLILSHLPHESGAKKRSRRNQVGPFDWDMVQFVTAHANKITGVQQGIVRWGEEQAGVSHIALLLSVGGDRNLVKLVRWSFEFQVQSSSRKGVVAQLLVCCSIRDVDAIGLDRLGG